MPDGLTVDIHSHVVFPEAARMVAGLMKLYPDRMDQACEVRPECQENIAERPSKYLRSLCFDTMGFGETSLGHLVSRNGAGPVPLGTEYPHHMGGAEPTGLIERVDGLSEDDAGEIDGGNAARLLEEDQ